VIDASFLESGNQEERFLWKGKLGGEGVRERIHCMRRLARALGGWGRRVEAWKEVEAWNCWCPLDRGEDFSK
jgi:hypothetical protein